MLQCLSTQDSYFKQCLHVFMDVFIFYLLKMLLERLHAIGSIFTEIYIQVPLHWARELAKNNNKYQWWLAKLSIEDISIIFFPITGKFIDSKKGSLIYVPCIAPSILTCYKSWKCSMLHLYTLYLHINIYS